MMTESLKAAKYRSKHFLWIIVFWIHIQKNLCSRYMFLCSCALTGTRVSQKEGSLWKTAKDLALR